MQDLVRPFPRRRPRLKSCGAVCQGDRQAPVVGFDGFHIVERNHEPEVAAEKEVIAVQVRFPFGDLTAVAANAARFQTHESLLEDYCFAFRLHQKVKPSAPREPGSRFLMPGIAHHHGKGKSLNSNATSCSICTQSWNTSLAGGPTLELFPAELVMMVTWALFCPVKKRFTFAGILFPLASWSSSRCWIVWNRP